MASDKEKKPVIVPSASSAFITLKIWAQDNSVVCYRIKRSAKLQKMMDLYAARQGVDTKLYRFLIDGDRLHGEQTPDEAGLNDEDQIDAMVEEIGG